MTVTYHNVLRATIEALGEMMAEYAGYRVTRLRDAHAVGETELRVESALGLTPSGVVLVEDEEGSAGEAVDYTGIDLTPGAQRLTGAGISLERAHREEAEVVDANRDWSNMDLLRRATLVDYAAGEDLDRVGRGVGVSRPRAFLDDTFRSLIKVLAYMAKTPVYSLEMVMDAIYGVGSGWIVYESLVEHPCKVFITIPTHLGSDVDGRTLMTTTTDVSAPPSPVDIPLSYEPNLVIDVKAQNETEALDMSVLPSAAAPAWTYVPEAVGAEAAYFLVIPTAWGDPVLQHITPPGPDSGRYEFAVPGIGTKWRVQASWRSVVLTSVGTGAWNIAAWDGERDIFLSWDNAQIYLAQSDGTIIVTVANNYADGAWHHFDLSRDDEHVVGRVDGVEVIAADAADFAATVTRAVTFGFHPWASPWWTEDWTVHWDNVEFYTKNDNNYWNLGRADGSLTAGSADLVSVSNPFVAGDVGRRVFIASTINVNQGLWEVFALVGPGTVTLEGVSRQANGYVSSLTPSTFSSYDAIFTDADLGKWIEITTGPNTGSYEISAIDSPYQVTVLLSAFVTETEITWRYDTRFSNEAGINFTLIDAGTISGANLVLRDPMPAAIPVTVHHTIQQSAQLCRGETIVNTGTVRQPFYLGGVAERTRAILSDVKAAGVILDYYRVY